MIDLKNLPKVLRDAADALEAHTMQYEATGDGGRLDDVRAVLVRKSTEGKREAVKALITKYGAERLSDIAPDAYAAMRQEAKAL